MNLKLRRNNVYKKRNAFFKVSVLALVLVLIVVISSSFANFKNEKVYNIIEAVVPQLVKNKITYHSNGGSACLESTYNPGEPLGDLCMPVLNNHIFLGWYDENGERYSNDTIIAESEDIDLTASWVVSSFSFSCNRAKSLQYEVCNATTGYGCLDNYAAGTKIYYGNLGSGANLVAGDAFDCDVNNDGFYDPVNERFYYVSSLPENNSYGVLIPSNSYADGAVINNNNSGTYYETSAVQTKGPITIYKRLPDSTEWSRVSLYNAVRDIKNDAGVVRKEAFNYGDVTNSTRYLTYQEIASGCGFSPSGTANELYNKCNFLLQNTLYTFASGIKQGYWLETPYSGNTTSIWYIDGKNARVYYTSAISTVFGSRPVIEVPKNKINTAIETNVKIKYFTNGGSNCADKTVNLNSTVGTLCTPTKFGYTFTGWVDKNGDAVNSNYKVMETPEIPLYATYKLDLICRRAQSLHTETCAAASGFGCLNLMSSGATVTYGKLGSGATLSTGDALDCDVNGDGTFDGVTERFYYVTNLESNNNYAVLQFYSSVKAGEPNSKQGYAYYTSGGQTNGPKTAYSYLPTATQWPNVALYNTVRDIVNESGVVRKAAFDYSVKTTAARLLTYSEIQAGCGITMAKVAGELDSTTCRFLLENTMFTNTSLKTGYWTETPTYGNTTSAWTVNGKYRYGTKIATTTTNDYGLRPAIEVPKSKILTDNYYIVYYSDSIGSGCVSNFVKNNSAYGTLCKPYSADYQFMGWYDANNNLVTESTIFNKGADITLTARWKNACTIGMTNTYNYTGTVTPITMLCDGYYKIEAYGAQGGIGSDTFIVDSSSVTNNNPGKLGDVESAAFYFKPNDKIYAVVGEKGKNGTTNYGSSAGIAMGGYNGGQIGDGRGGGGGATHVSRVTGLWSSNNSDVIICAQGGQGGRSGGLGGGISYIKSNYNGNDVIFSRHNINSNTGDGKIIITFLGQ